MTEREREGELELKRRKTTLKRHVSTLIKYVSEYNENGGTEKLLQSQLGLCMSRIKELEDLLDEAQDGESNYFDNMYNEVGEIKKNIFENENKINEIIKKKKDANVIGDLPEAQVVNMEAKLPQINLPKFNGKVENWLSFKNSFDALIGSKPNLSNITKLQYLMLALEGEAANIVEGLALQDDNFKNAIEMLSQRYEHKRVLVQRHIKPMVEFPMMSRESREGMRNLVDTFTQNCRALESLGRPVDHWDDILVYLALNKLPINVRRDWESKLDTQDLPSYKLLENFLVHRCQILDMCHSKDTNSNDNRVKLFKDFKVCHLTDRKTTCNICDQEHFTNQCKKLLNLALEERYALISEKKLCKNCFRRGHIARFCRSPRCIKCQKLHNVLLHSDNEIKHDKETVHKSETVEAPVTLQCLNEEKISLLSTCIVEVSAQNGERIDARIMLDTGSQVNLIRKSFAQKLGIKMIEESLPIVGLNGLRSISRGKIKTTIRSKTENFVLKVELFLIDKLPDCVPHYSIPFPENVIPPNITLADPTFNQSRDIDMLIGVQHFYECLKAGSLKVSKANVNLQNSVFGWIISGKFSYAPLKESAVCNVACNDRLDETLRCFWEIENCAKVKVRSKEEMECESNFVKNVKRDSDGRFIVALPWKRDPKLLGNSIEIAKKRFFNLEKQLIKNINIKNEYDEFLKEYIDLGHMVMEGSLESFKDNDIFVLPHHAVYKHEGKTRKIRVVFDASARSSNGWSLNDMLMRGPLIQSDLFDILIRFRCHKYVVTADITKMYRQILIKPEDARYQHIIYRFDDSDTIKVYKLKTLTYGTRPASFLATRCLVNLAERIESKMPDIARIIKEDFYMDDMLTGHDDDNVLINIKNEVSELLNSAGMPLRKWCSNLDRIIKPSPKNEGNYTVSCKESEFLKTLGIFWSPSSDMLGYKLNMERGDNVVTKRRILSDIASLFDPLGLVGPLIVNAKLIMQGLWKLSIGWDEQVPKDVEVYWARFLKDLLDVTKVENPRYCLLEKSRYELVGFADASEKAYGACVYIRSIGQGDIVYCSLVASKSRIAPIKVVSLPRLELCAAVLLVELMSKIIKALRIKIEKQYYFSDSTIVLNWLKGCPTRWKVFVSHRVAEIQLCSNIQDWYHVQSADNPADVISRGSSAVDLIKCNLWWHGPAWLCEANISEHLRCPAIEELPEVRVNAVAVARRQLEIIDRYSDYSKLVRVLCYCKRFVLNCRNKVKSNSIVIEAEEYREGEKVLIRLVQGQAFHSEINDLNKKSRVDKMSNIAAFKPWLDRDGLLRIGGRLKNSDIQYEAKHQLILPSRSKVTDNLIRSEHFKLKHAGPLSVLASLRERFWIINAKSTVKRVIRRCLVCFKVQPKCVIPEMANLPSPRVVYSRPFTHTGMDFCGPFFIKEGIRSRNKRKAYVCLFICLCTKAVHCEVVESLSTEAFISALKRFVARRGTPSELYCDNGTNFVGASRELKDIMRQLNSIINDDCVKTEMNRQNIKFNFNPPRAPHFGGLWEASVKSLKRHVYKVAGETVFTFIELVTLITEIEAIMNSRPITPISDHIEDLDVLTPGHFLIFSHLRSLPEINFEHAKKNTLSRWQMVQQISQNFWKRWRQDYLQELQKRSKWLHNAGAQVSEGQLVLVKEDNLPARLWKTARIIKTHPGSDGIIRVVTLKTKSGEVQRPVVRIAVLPLEDNENEV